jgi:hypothetical protein
LYKFKSVLVRTSSAFITGPSNGTAAVKPRPLKKKVPSGYIKFTDHSYFSYNPGPATWVEARDNCEKEGAHLAVINSEAEAKFTSSIRTPGGPDWVFIGMHDFYTEGKFVTIFSKYSHNDTLWCE